MTNATNRTDRYNFRIHQCIAHPDTKRQCNMGMTYTTSRTSRKKANEAKIHAKKKKKKNTFQDQLTTKNQSHSPPTAKIWLRNKIVQPAQLVVPVAEEYRSRV